jgi:hypothetical protein
MTAARRSGELVRRQSQQHHNNLIRDQEREREAIGKKTARLLELRLAKEAAEKKAEALKPAPAKRPRAP